MKLIRNISSGFLLRSGASGLYAVVHWGISQTAENICAKLMDCNL